MVLHVRSFKYVSTYNEVCWSYACYTELLFSWGNVHYYRSNTVIGKMLVETYYCVCVCIYIYIYICV